jgi:hypothetical protein
VDNAARSPGQRASSNFETGLAGGWLRYRLKPLFDEDFDYFDE